MIEAFREKQRRRRRDRHHHDETPKQKPEAEPRGRNVSNTRGIDPNLGAINSPREKARTDDWAGPVPTRQPGKFLGAFKIFAFLVWHLSGTISEADEKLTPSRKVPHKFIRFVQHDFPVRLLLSLRLHHAFGSDEADEIKSISNFGLHGVGSEGGRDGREERNRSREPVFVLDEIKFRSVNEETRLSESAVAAADCSRTGGAEFMQISAV